MGLYKEAKTRVRIDSEWPKQLDAKLRYAKHSVHKYNVRTGKAQGFNTCAHCQV